VASMLPNMLATNLEEEQESRLLLPKPEELPMLEDRNDSSQSLIWLSLILICLVAVVLMSHGLM
jgi:hypothetical protein